MKLQHLIPILFLASFCTVSAQTNTPTTPALLTTNQAVSLAGSVFKQEVAKKLSDIVGECREIKPGMTRAVLTNDFIEIQTDGTMNLNYSPFEQHQTFYYRDCHNIQIDVDFAPSQSKQERPADIITKISRPYLEWEPSID